MSIQSMTGYGRAELSRNGLTVVCEMRSLNGRHLEADVRIPKFMYELDSQIRKILSNTLERGTVTVIYNISFVNQNDSLTEIVVNEPLARKYLETFTALSEKLNVEFRNQFQEVIRIPDVISASDKSLSDDNKKLIVEVTQQAADAVYNFRCTEGKNIAEKLQESVLFIKQHLEVIKAEEIPRKNAIRERVYNNILENIKRDLVDENRLEQEILIYLDKWDISEEKNRLAQHIDYFIESLELDGQGKKLNFICQEMGREINTLGVKSNHFPMQQAVVVMKEKLEQMKEQLVNLV